MRVIGDIHERDTALHGHVRHGVLASPAKPCVAGHMADGRRAGHAMARSGGRIRGGRRGEHWSPAAADLQGLGPGRDPRDPLRVLRPGAARVPELPGEAAGPAAHRRRAGPRALHGARRLQGPAGVPAQRPHGVRVGLRARRLPRPGLHRRLPAAGVEHRPARLRRSGLGLGGPPDDRGLPHQSLRRADRDAHDQPAAGGRVRDARAVLQPVLLGPGERPRPAPEGDHGPGGAAAADRVLRLDGVGRVDRPAGPQLLVHE